MEIPQIAYHTETEPVQRLPVIMSDPNIRLNCSGLNRLRIHQRAACKDSVVGIGRGPWIPLRRVWPTASSTGSALCSRHGTLAPASAETSACSTFTKRQTSCYVSRTLKNQSLLHKGALSHGPTASMSIDSILIVFAFNLFPLISFLDSVSSSNLPWDDGSKIIDTPYRSNWSVPR